MNRRPNEIIDLENANSPTERRKSLGEALIEIVQKASEESKTEKTVDATKKRKITEIESDASASSEDDLPQKTETSSSTSLKKSKTGEGSKPLIKPVQKSTSNKKPTEDLYETLPENWKSLRFDKINIEKISVQDMNSVLSYFEEIKGTNLLLRYELEQLEKVWQERLDRLLESIIIKSVEGILASDFSVQFDIQEEDKKWQEIKQLSNRIQRIILNFERHCTTNVQLMKELTERNKLRKEKSIRQKEALDREIANLPNRQQKTQLKFFISQYGPLEGRRQYRSFEETQTLSTASEFMAKQFKQSADLMDGVIAKNQSLQNAVAASNIVIVEDDDELLNEKLT